MYIDKVSQVHVYSIRSKIVGGAVASRKCLGGYDDGTRFGSISYSTGCEPFPVLDESDSTASLKAQAEVN